MKMETIIEEEAESARRAGYPEATVHWTDPDFVLMDEHSQIHLVAEGQARYSREFMDMHVVEDIRYKFRYAEK